MFSSNHHKFKRKVRGVTVLCIFIFLLAENCSAQNNLPFYEQNSIGEYYLLLSDSIPDLKQSNQVSIISKHGIVGSGKFINLHITTEKECCTHHDTFFLMGTLKLNCKPDSIYYLIAGVIKEGKLFNTKFDSVPDEKNFVTSDFQKTILDINYENLEVLLFYLM